jgi:L-threonylcarbamoyladenylate synthase
MTDGGLPSTVVKTHLMHTERLPATEAGLARAAALLRAGEVVAFPTETVYGLGGDAIAPAAVDRIFAAKGRPADDPLIVHVAAVNELAHLTPSLTPLISRLAAHFWPGPLTLIVPRGPAVPLRVSAGRNTVAVRIPAHPLAQALIRAAGTPLAAPSANRFGHTSPTTAAHVLSDLDGRIAAVLDGGATPIGIESTVLDLTSATPTVLRPGGVSYEALVAVLGEVALGGRAAVPGEGMIAPGLLDRHYAPETPFWLVIGAPDAARAWLREQIAQHTAQGKRVGLLVTDEESARFAQAGVMCEPLGRADDLAQIAHNMYAALRALDARRPDIILARDFGTVGLALALRDRLTRAAAGQVVWLDIEE